MLEVVCGLGDSRGGWLVRCPMGKDLDVVKRQGKWRLRVEKRVRRNGSIVDSKVEGLYRGTRQIWALDGDRSDSTGVEEEEDKDIDGGKKIVRKGKNRKKGARYPSNGQTQSSKSSGQKGGQSHFLREFVS